MQHKHIFALGDNVEWLRTPHNALRSNYKVVGIVPPDHEGDPQYKIRSEYEVADRMVSEVQICSRPMSPRMTGLQRLFQFNSENMADAPRIMHDHTPEIRPRSNQTEEGVFEQDFEVTPPGSAGLSELAIKLDALKRSGMIKIWFYGSWKNHEKTVHGILFSSSRELDAARLCISH